MDQRKKSKRPPKAYRNIPFLNSPDARTIRILAEYNEPLSRFNRYGIENLIVFFGSARSTDLKTAKKEIVQNNKKLDIEELNELEQKKLQLASYYEDAVELSKRLTLWAMDDTSNRQSYYICSGGGPGMMEAANKGAKLAKGKSIGLNISIPTEQFPNPYISEELKFEFHYFFIRKFWFVYLAKAMVIFPGGFGTMDEWMEVLTLIQTQKIKKNLPIVVYGSAFWNDVLNLDALVRWGTIDKSDLKLFKIINNVDSAFDYLTENMSQQNRG
jgi:uncharacterized protein (TIGR00730 family)